MHLQRTVRRFACAVAVTSAAACNSIIGVESPTRVGEPTHGGPPSDADAGPLGPGPYVLATTGPNVDTVALESVTATVTAGGEMTGWVAVGQSPLLGTNTVFDGAGADGPVVWGRWAGGTTSGRYTQTNPVTRSFVTDSGLHYALGRPPITAAPASGTFRYNRLGGTHATSGDGVGQPGLPAGAASIAFTPSGASVGISLTIDMPGDAKYVVESPGGLDTPSMSKLTFVAGHSVMLGASDGFPVPTTGRACSAGNCVAKVTGFFAGDDYERLALAIQIFSGGAPGATRSVSTIVVLQK